MNESYTKMKLGAHTGSDNYQYNLYLVICLYSTKLTWIKDW